MKRELYFEKVETIGDLYLEHIFFEYENEAIVFLCGSDSGNLYFCVCSEIRYVQKWMLAEISMEQLKQLIVQRIDLLSVFRERDELLEICMHIEGKETSRIVRRSDVDPLDLPKKGTYLRCDENSANEYLWNKRMQMRMLAYKTYLTEHKFLGGETEKYDFSVTVNNHRILSKKASYTQIVTEESVEVSERRNENSVSCDYVSKCKYNVVMGQKSYEMVDKRAFISSEIFAA